MSILSVASASHPVNAKPIVIVVTVINSSFLIFSDHKSPSSLQYCIIPSLQSAPVYGLQFVPSFAQRLQVCFSFLYFLKNAINSSSFMLRILSNLLMYSSYLPSNILNSIDTVSSFPNIIAEKK